jgi:hypothetical protein
MHPVTQAILAVGVLALVGMGGYALAVGIPEKHREPTAMERLQATMDEADEVLCRAKLSRPLSAYTEAGKREWRKCARDYDL